MNAITQATQPENRLQQVIALGICFLIDMESYLFEFSDDSLVTYSLLVKSNLYIDIKWQIKVDT